MQTVPLALVRGAEGQPEERTLGTAVPAEGWTLAGTGALECQPSAGTERNWALQCPSPARHWPPRRESAGSPLPTTFQSQTALKSL